MGACSYVRLCADVHDCIHGPESAKTRLRVKFHKMTFPIFSFYWARGVRKQNITGVGRLIVVLKASQTHLGIVLKNPKKTQNCYHRKEMKRDPPD